MASQITGVPIVCWTVCPSADQRKHQSSAYLAFVGGIHWSPMGSPHKGPVTREMLTFDDVIIKIYVADWRRFPKFQWSMMTSSNGNIFRVTGPLCGEFTGHGEFPTQRPVTRSFDVFFDLRLNKRLSKQPWGWWFETPSLSSWRHCNGTDLDGLIVTPDSKVHGTNMRPTWVLSGPYGPHVGLMNLAFRDMSYMFLTPVAISFAVPASGFRVSGAYIAGYII